MCAESCAQVAWIPRAIVANAHSRSHDGCTTAPKSWLASSSSRIVRRGLLPLPPLLLYYDSSGLSLYLRDWSLFLFFFYFFLFSSYFRFISFFLFLFLLLLSPSLLYVHNIATFSPFFFRDRGSGRRNLRRDWLERRCKLHSHWLSRAPWWQERRRGCSRAINTFCSSRFLISRTSLLYTLPILRLHRPGPGGETAAAPCSLSCCDVVFFRSLNPVWLSIPFRLA